MSETEDTVCNKEDVISSDETKEEAVNKLSPDCEKEEASELMKNDSKQDEDVESEVTDSKNVENGELEKMEDSEVKEDCDEVNEVENEKENQSTKVDSEENKNEEEGNIDDGVKETTDGIENKDEVEGNDEGDKETTAEIENKDEVEGNDDGEKETTDEIDKLVTVDGDDVVTVDDDEGEENIPSITIPDVVFFDMVSEEEKKYYEDNPIPLDKVEDMKIQCTACWKQVNHRIPNNIQRHPQLGVPICRNCKHFYEDGDWEKDDEGSDMYCRWCGNGGEVLGCDKCKVYVYCKQCITRNCGRAKFAEINESEEWACFACEPSQIYKERSQMLALARWAAERKKLKRKCGGRKETPKKKKEDPEKVKENRKRKREETQKRKLEEEIGKLESFIDENIHEAFDTLAIYQKCLEDERRKWIRVRKSMNANNAATAAKSLRRIYEITKQNMELLDHSLVEGYKAVFPDEGQKKLKFTTDPKPSPKPSPNKHGQTNKQTNMAAKQRTKEVRNESVDMDDDIEVEGIVLNGEAVYANGEDGGGMGDFDPSLLCSVEISTGRDSDSCSTPTPRTPRQPLKKKMKLNKSVTKSPSSGPVPSHGRIKISNKFLKKKPKSTPIKMKPTKRKAEDDDDIEEITIDDDEDSVSYVSQPVLAKKSLKKQRLSEDDDDNFDSDVSLE